MKDIITSINESKQDLCPEVQNEFDKDYAYQSFSTSKPKFKYGFLMFDGDNEFYSVVAFNKDSEYAESIANDYNLDVEDLTSLKVGEAITDESHGPNYVYAITRIW